MSRIQSPTRKDPSSNMSTERILGDILTKLQSIEISQLFKKRKRKQSQRNVGISKIYR